MITHVEVWAKDKRVRVFRSMEPSTVHREWTLGEGHQVFSRLVWSYLLPGAVEAVFGYGGGGERWDYNCNRQTKLDILERWRKSAKADGFHQVGWYTDNNGHKEDVVLV